MLGSTSSKLKALSVIYIINHATTSEGFVNVENLSDDLRRVATSQDDIDILFSAQREE